MTKLQYIQSLLLVGLIFASACKSGPSKNVSKTTKPIPKPKVIKPSLTKPKQVNLFDLKASFQLVETVALNNYEIKVSVQSNKVLLGERKTRLSASENSTRPGGINNVSKTLNSNLKTVVFKNLNFHYSPYTLEIENKDGSFQEYQIEVPIDISFRGNREYKHSELVKNYSQYIVNDELVANRVNFAANTTYIIDNVDSFLFSANRITTNQNEYALLKCEFSGLRAPRGQDGHDGCDIRIEANSLVGDLSVNTSGEHGGHASTTNHYARSGGSGGFIEIEVKDLTRGVFNTRVLGGTGGGGSKHGPGKNGKAGLVEHVD